MRRFSAYATVAALAAAYFAYNHFYGNLLPAVLLLALAGILCLAFYGYRRFRPDRPPILAGLWTAIFGAARLELTAGRLAATILLTVYAAANVFLLKYYQAAWTDGELLFSSVRAQASIAVRIILPLLFQAALFFLAYALGSRWLDRSRMTAGLAESEKAVLSVGYGFLPIIFSVLALLFFGWLSRVSAWSMFLILLVLAWPGLRSGLAAIRGWRWRIDLDRDDIGARFLLAAGLAICLAFSAVAIAKPAPITTDDLHTYWNTPLLFSEYGSYRPFGHLDHANAGQATEMVYAGIISALDSRFIVHFQFFAFLAGLWALYLLLKRWFGNEAAFYGAAFACLVPWNFFYANTVKVEHFLFFCLTLMMIALFPRNGGPGRAGPLVLAGLFAGLAVGIKYSAAFLVVPAYALAAGLAVKQGGGQAKALFISVLAALAVFSPWAAKNIHYFGHPFHPLEVLGGHASPDPARLQYAKDFYRERREELSRIRHSLEPEKLSIGNYILTNLNQSTGRQVDRGAWINFGLLGPLFLPLLFLAARDRRQRLAIALLAAYFLFWYAADGARNWYALWGYGALAALAAVVLGPYPRARYLALLLLLPPYLFGLYVIPGNIKYFSGQIGQSGYMEYAIPYFKTARYLNDPASGVDGKILVLGDFRSALIDRNDERLLLDPFFYHSGWYLADEKRPLSEHLKAAGFSHVIYSRLIDAQYLPWPGIKGLSLDEYDHAYRGRYNSIFRDIAEIKDFISHETAPVFSDGYYTLYRIN